MLCVEAALKGLITCKILVCYHGGVLLGLVTRLGNGPIPSHPFMLCTVVSFELRPKAVHLCEETQMEWKDPHLAPLSRNQRVSTWELVALSAAK